MTFVQTPVHTRCHAAVGQDPSVRGRKRQNRSPASRYRIDEIELSPAVIRNEDRAAYCDSLDDACVSNNHAGIARLIAEPVLRSFDLYFDAWFGCQPRTFLGPSVNNRDTDIKARSRVIANVPCRWRDAAPKWPDVRLTALVWPRHCEEDIPSISNERPPVPVASSTSQG